MLFKWAKPWILVLAGVMLQGLCPAVLANTTVVEPIANDIGGCRIPLASIALLLPSRSGSLGSAADALRSGFLAVYEHDKKRLAITIIETVETPADMLAAYLAASQKFDILVGPLSRTGITAIFQSGKVSKRTIALAQLDSTAEGQTILPQLLLPIGLSIEAEARQVANWVSRAQGPDKVFVIATRVNWQQRVATAFVQQATNVGLQTDVLILDMLHGIANTGVLEQLNQRVQIENSSAIFVALSADQALQVCNAVGADLPMYGISQLNSLVSNESNPLARLNGIRLLDIPWLLTPDNPAMTFYPHQVISDGVPRNADLERLYALDIDAYNVARRVAARNPAFQINGMTGKLDIRFGVGTPAFERTEPAAVYQDGIAVPA